MPTLLPFVLPTFLRTLPEKSICLSYCSLTPLQLSKINSASKSQFLPYFLYEATPNYFGSCFPFLHVLFFLSFFALKGFLLICHEISWLYNFPKHFSSCIFQFFPTLPVFPMQYKMLYYTSAPFSFGKQCNPNGINGHTFLSN